MSTHASGRRVSVPFLMTVLVVRVLNAASGGRMPWAEPAYRSWLSGEGDRETEQSVKGEGLPVLVAQALHAGWFVLAVVCVVVMVQLDPEEAVWTVLLVVLTAGFSVGVANSAFGYIPEQRLSRWSRSRVTDLLWLVLVVVIAAVYWFVIIPR
ncbi:hypothetical protein [Micromonospora sp. LOL_021]|uniref:hypothetical protein n=1 Tax=Micromonospora sp. LOL_021 TaxID=3345417 RepID=UPI003A86A293